MTVPSAAMAAALVAVLAAPAAAAPPKAQTGPYAGVISQGEVHEHEYNNNPGNQNCIALAQAYRVSLSHVPATDTLTLNVAGVSVTTTGGGTSVYFVSGVCTSFGFTVTGTSVADKAAYAVTIWTGPLAAEWAAIG